MESVVESEHPINQGTARLTPHRRQTTRWSHLKHGKRETASSGMQFLRQIPKPPHINGTSKKAGAAAELTANLKIEKYRELIPKYLFVPVAVKTLGPINEEGANFLCDLGSQIEKITQDPSRKMSHIPTNFGGGSTEKRFIFRRMFSGGGVVVGLTVFRLWGFCRTGTVGH